MISFRPSPTPIDCGLCALRESLYLYILFMKLLLVCYWSRTTPSYRTFIYIGNI